MRAPGVEVHFEGGMTIGSGRTDVLGKRGSVAWLGPVVGMPEDDTLAIVPDEDGVEVVVMGTDFSIAARDYCGLCGTLMRT